MSRHLRALFAVILASAAAWAAANPQIAEPVALRDDESRGTHEFTNPIVPAQGKGGPADPSVVFHNGFYYYCRSLNDGAIGVARAARLQDIGSVPMRVVWTAPAGTRYSREVWAPELQYLEGKWYIYFAASDGDNANHRMYALEGRTQDPQAGYEFKGRLAPPDSDEWAIDGLAMQHADGLYFVWSGWQHAGDGFPQVTYIARMQDPLTISGTRHQIAAPELAWEKEGAPLMEGHSVLQRNDKIFIVYSTSASWTDDYKLGMLTYSGGDILAAASWKKSPMPVFSKLDRGGTFGPGHNTFVTSPDGTEDWIVYHAVETSGGGWSKRSVRAQRFDWNADGSPNFSSPVALGMRLAEPSQAALPAVTQLATQQR